LYGYAGGDPINYHDPFGLCAQESASDTTKAQESSEGCRTTTEKVVDFSAGLGDALLLGAGPFLRQALGIDGVDRCSSAYSAGAVASLAVGTARIGYAVAAKGISVMAATPAAASAGRESLKQAFRLGMGSGYRAVDASRYASPEALRSAAGRTSAKVNSYGAGVAAAGAVGASGSSCP
jgi:hypothetical protein